MDYFHSDHRFDKRELSPFVRIMVFSITPFSLVLAYKVILNSSPSIIDMGIVILLGIGLAFIVRSFIKSPAQFLAAAQQRVRWVALHLVAAFYTVVNLIRALFSMFLRLFVWIIILIVYLISPIDLIPDVLIPVGFLDDLGFAYFVFRGANFVLSQNLKQKAKEAIEDAYITTSFP